MCRTFQFRSFSRTNIIAVHFLGSPPFFCRLSGGRSGNVVRTRIGKNILIRTGGGFHRITVVVRCLGCWWCHAAVSCVCPMKLLFFFVACWSMFFHTRIALRKQDTTTMERIRSTTPIAHPFEFVSTTTFESANQSSPMHSSSNHE